MLEKIINLDGPIALRIWIRENGEDSDELFKHNKNWFHWCWFNDIIHASKEQFSYFKKRFPNAKHLRRYTNEHRATKVRLGKDELPAKKENKKRESL